MDETVYYLPQIRHSEGPWRSLTQEPSEDDAVSAAAQSLRYNDADQWRVVRVTEVEVAFS